MALSFESRRRRRYAVAVIALCFSFVVAALSVAPFVGGASAQAVRPPADAAVVEEPAGEGPQSLPSPAAGPVGGAVPGDAKGTTSDAGLWRAVREGDRFTVSIPDEKAAVLVQSEGDAWRAFRNGPLQIYGAYAMAGILALIAVFFLLRGRIRVDSGMSGEKIPRFNGLERFSHWLMAGSFIVLAITGLNVSYGRYVLLPVMGADAFSAMSIAGKWLHNNVAWAFMIGLALSFVLWVGRNVPGWTDVKWIAKGGGLLVKGVHPDARKFNAGQKLVFWATMLLGLSVSMSGIALLFPFETQMMGKTFAFLNTVGFNLPTDLTPIREMQLQTLWHSIVAIAMIVIIIAHIYIGSLGMEGAFAAMGSGQVDINWAKEHHNLWVEEEVAKGRAPQAGAGRGAATPAE